MSKPLMGMLCFVEQAGEGAPWQNIVSSTCTSPPQALSRAVQAIRIHSDRSLFAMQVFVRAWHPATQQQLTVWQGPLTKQHGLTSPAAFARSLERSSSATAKLKGDAHPTPCSAHVCQTTTAGSSPCCCCCYLQDTVADGVGDTADATAAAAASCTSCKTCWQCHCCSSCYCRCCRCCCCQCCCQVLLSVQKGPMHTTKCALERHLSHVSETDRALTALPAPAAFIGCSQAAVNPEPCTALLAQWLRAL